MVKYKAVESSSIDSLNIDVNYHLEKDWKPLGGVSVTTKSVAGMNRFVYVQALVLDDRPLEDKVT